MKRKMSRTLHKKWSFPLGISSVNVTKSAVSCWFGHIYWRNPWWKTSFFVQWDSEKLAIIIRRGSNKNLWTFTLLLFIQLRVPLRERLSSVKVLEKLNFSSLLSKGYFENKSNFQLQCTIYLNDYRVRLPFINTQF